MDESTYVAAIANFYKCDISLAKKIIKSAELNDTKDTLDRIAEEYINNAK